ncbi:hypothetical protein EZBTHKR_1193 [Elizabethkingia anophelis]|nr:hypothetical protein EZBTHKR_1193 [Elizabethkingia anophelis]
MLKHFSFYNYKRYIIADEKLSAPKKKYTTKNRSYNLYFRR